MNERDTELEKLYREHSREEPPSALDAKILAAAHRAVASGPQKIGAEATRPQRWWMPLAAAAAIGVVAIGVIQQVPKDTAIDATSIATTSRDVAPPPAALPPVAPPPAASPPPATTAPAPAPMQAPAPQARMESQPALPVDASKLLKKQKEADAPPSRPAPPQVNNAAKPGADEKLAAERGNKAPAAEPTPFPAAPLADKTEAASTVTAKRDAPMEQSLADRRKDSFSEGRQAAAPAIAGAAPAPSTPAAAPAPPAPAPAPLRERARAQSETAAGASAEHKNVEAEMRSFARDPDAWIARIRKLRDDGNTAQALRELKEFRALVPDAERKLPADLRALQP